MPMPIWAMHEHRVNHFIVFGIVVLFCSGVDLEICYVRATHRSASSEPNSFQMMKDEDLYRTADSEHGEKICFFVDGRGGGAQQ